MAELFGTRRASAGGTERGQVDKNCEERGKEEKEGNEWAACAQPAVSEGSYALGLREQRAGRNKRCYLPANSFTPLRSEITVQ